MSAAHAFQYATPGDWANDDTKSACTYYPLNRAGAGTHGQDAGGGPSLISSSELVKNIGHCNRKLLFTVARLVRVPFGRRWSVPTSQHRKAEPRRTHQRFRPITHMASNALENKYHDEPCNLPTELLIIELSPARDWSVSPEWLDAIRYIMCTEKRHRAANAENTGSKTAASDWAAVLPLEASRCDSKLLSTAKRSRRCTMPNGFTERVLRVNWADNVFDNFCCGPSG